MRQVKVSRKVWVANVQMPGAGSWVQRDYFAVFHDFGLDTDNSQGNNEIYPVAILELADGTVQVVHVEHIQFVKPTLYETCEN